MLVLDYPRTTPAAKPSIAVPPFHTGHLGFVPNTPVHIGIVTPQKQHSELVIAPFSQDWQYLAAVTVTMHDRPGVVAQLATAFAAVGINIDTQESASVNHLDHHFVNLIVDFSTSPRLSVLPAPDTPAPIKRLYRAYGSLLSLHDFRFVQLFESIMLQCADAVVWHHVGGEWLPDISIRALPHRPLAKPSSSFVGAAQGPLQAQVPIPAGIAVTLRAALGLAVTDNFQYISISDTSTRSLRVFFFHPSAVGAFFHIGVYHDDVPGALAALLTLMRDAKFNILTSLTRKQPEGQSVWEALVHYVGDATDVPDPENRVAHSRPSEEDLEWVHLQIRESARTRATDLAKYAIKLGSPRYPRRGAVQATRTTSPKEHPPPIDLDLSEQGEIGAVVSGNPDVSVLSATRREKVANASEFDDAGRDRIYRLLDMIERRSELGGRATIFVSFPQRIQNMVTKLMERLREWYVVSYYQKPDGKLILEEAIRLIAECDYFIGVWHPDSPPSDKEKTTTDLSAWMPFEYGVARAQEKPCHVVHCDLLDASVWRRVDPGVASPEYATDAFVDETIPEIVQFCRSNFR
jgi:hypothetical protein